MFQTTNQLLIHTNLLSIKIYESICSIHPNEAIQIHISPYLEDLRSDWVGRAAGGGETSNQRLSDFGGRVHIQKLCSKYLNMGNKWK